MDFSDPSDPAPPREFMCRITGQLMTDPVVVIDGETYDRGAILKHFAFCRSLGQSPTSPVSNEVLEHDVLLPNKSLMRRIQGFMDMQSVVRQQRRAIQLKIDTEGMVAELMKKMLKCPYVPEIEGPEMAAALCVAFAEWGLVLTVQDASARPFLARREEAQRMVSQQSLQAMHSSPFYLLPPAPSTATASFGAAAAAAAAAALPPPPNLPTPIQQPSLSRQRGPELPSSLTSLSQSLSLGSSSSLLMQQQRILEECASLVTQPPHALQDASSLERYAWEDEDYRPPSMAGTSLPVSLNSLESNALGTLAARNTHTTQSSTLTTLTTSSDATTSERSISDDECWEDSREPTWETRERKDKNGASASASTSAPASGSSNKAGGDSDWKLPGKRPSTAKKYVYAASVNDAEYDGEAKVWGDSRGPSDPRYKPALIAGTSQTVHIMKHGLGICHSRNGDIYWGQFVNNQRCGHGKLEEDNKGENKGRALYDGEFKGNLKSGHGVYVYPTGTTYTGAWEKDKLHGKGVLTGKHGIVLKKGEWNTGIFRTDNAEHIHLMGSDASRRR